MLAFPLFSEMEILGIKVKKEVEKATEEVKESLNKVLESMSTIRQDIKTHVKNIKDTLEENKRTCPRCKSELVERTGVYGKFLGCSSYPKCRYTYKQI